MYINICIYIFIFICEYRYSSWFSKVLEGYIYISQNALKSSCCMIFHSYQIPGTSDEVTFSGCFKASSLNAVVKFIYEANPT